MRCNLSKPAPALGVQMVQRFREAIRLSRAWALGAEYELVAADLQEEMLSGLRLDGLPDELLSLDDLAEEDVADEDIAGEDEKGDHAEAREGQVIERWRRRAGVYQQRIRGVDDAVLVIFRSFDPRSTGCIPKGVVPRALVALGAEPAPHHLELIMDRPGRYVTAVELQAMAQIFVPQLAPRTRSLPERNDLFARAGRSITRRLAELPPLFSALSSAGTAVRLRAERAGAMLSIRRTLRIK